MAEALRWENTHAIVILLFDLLAGGKCMCPWANSLALQSLLFYISIVLRVSAPHIAYRRPATSHFRCHGHETDIVVNLNVFRQFDFKGSFKAFFHFITLQTTLRSLNKKRAWQNTSQVHISACFMCPYTQTWAFKHFRSQSQTFSTLELQEMQKRLHSYSL